jgi:hypothetical protein
MPIMMSAAAPPDRRIGSAKKSGSAGSGFLPCLRAVDPQGLYSSSFSSPTERTQDHVLPDQAVRVPFLPTFNIRGIRGERRGELRD